MNEKEFSKALTGLLDIAKAQNGMVEKDQIEAAFKEFGLDDNTMGLVLDYLKEKHVGIGAPIDAEEYLSDEETNYLSIYLEELEALPAVSEGEKEAITYSAMAGDKDAQNRLVEVYLPDVVQIAKLYAGQGVMLEDLIGEGNVALAMGVSMLGALEKASEAQGMLGKLIMDGMEDLIAESVEESKKDNKIADKVNKVAQKADELSEAYQKKVTVEELMEETGFSRKAITDAIRMSGYKIDSIENNEEA